MYIPLYELQRRLGKVKYTVIISRKRNNGFSKHLHLDTFPLKSGTVISGNLMLIIFVFPLNIVTYKNMQTLCGFLDRKGVSVSWSVVVTCPEKPLMSKEPDVGSFEF